MASINLENDYIEVDTIVIPWGEQKLVVNNQGDSVEFMWEGCGEFLSLPKDVVLKLPLLLKRMQELGWV